MKGKLKNCNTLLEGLNVTKQTYFFFILHLLHCTQLLLVCVKKYQ